MVEYRLSPAAQDDLDGIFDYTVRELGTGAGRELHAVARGRLHSRRRSAITRAGLRTYPVGIPASGSGASFHLLHHHGLRHHRHSHPARAHARFAALVAFRGRLTGLEFQAQWLTAFLAVPKFTAPNIHWKIGRIRAGSNPTPETSKRSWLKC